MREYMGEDRFSALQAALIKAGFSGYCGEPDLFCFTPDGAWFFAEAKREANGKRDRLRDSQIRWFAIAKNVLGARHAVRVYCVRPGENSGTAP